MTMKTVQLSVTPTGCIAIFKAPSLHDSEDCPTVAVTPTGCIAVFNLSRTSPKILLAVRRGCTATHGF